MKCPDLRTDLIAALSELIDALDRRVAHVERAGEAEIAADAATLRRKAVARIEDLKRAGTDHRSDDAELADAIMSDEGGRSHLRVP